MEDKEKIINAIRQVTNGTFIGEYCTTTLLGYLKIYDYDGREVSVDPNYVDSCINIDGVNYNITRHGWNVHIWKPEYEDARYTWCWKDNYKNYLFAELNIMPDYVKEYWEHNKTRVEDL